MTSRTAVPRGPRSRVTVVIGAVMALVAGLLAFGTPAYAASTATFKQLGYGAQVGGTVGSNTISTSAGEMLISIDGGNNLVAFCIDIHTSIANNTGGLVEQGWSESGIANLDQVSWVLNTYQAPGYGDLAGTRDQKAAAVQAAIWHLTDGFDLTSAHDNVKANYDAILAAIPTEGLPQEPAPSLSITPASATALVGEAAGPFTVSTNGSNIPLTVDGGQVVDAAGDPLDPAVVDDGTEFWLRSDVEATVTAGAQTSTTIHAGRVFYKHNTQRLILATQTEAGTQAEVSATFSEPEPTTTTTETTTTETTTTETTTTTWPATTTTTTEPEASTTTEPEVTTTVPSDVGGVTEEPDEEVLVGGDSLPRTGAGVGSALLVAGMMLGLGSGLVASTRRRR